MPMKAMPTVAQVVRLLPSEMPITELSAKGRKNRNSPATISPKP